MTVATLDRPWLKAYPPGVPYDVDTSQYTSLVALMAKPTVCRLLLVPICKASA